jgi:hypothetical protein
MVPIVQIYCAYPIAFLHYQSKCKMTKCISKSIKSINCNIFPDKNTKSNVPTTFPNT